MPEISGAFSTFFCIYATLIHIFHHFPPPYTPVPNIFTVVHGFSDRS